MSGTGGTILSNGKGHLILVGLVKVDYLQSWGPKYSSQTKPKWPVPFDVPREISGILG